MKSVLGPANSFAKLAVADDVNSGFGLLADNFLNARTQALRIGFDVVGSSSFLLSQKGGKIVGPDETADMGRENAVNATFHFGVVRKVICSTRNPDGGWSRRRPVCRFQAVAASRVGWRRPNRSSRGSTSSRTTSKSSKKFGNATAIPSRPASAIRLYCWTTSSGSPLTRNVPVPLTKRSRR